ncbi:MAG: glycerophosphodiester phosphodiesterase family protein, partial [Spirochaetales bacterium]
MENQNMQKLALPEEKRPLLFAHRGVSSLAPENTLAAFKKAKELGIPGVELDVHLTKDGQLVVIHDESIVRTGRIYTTGMSEPQPAPNITVEKSTWEELQQYDFGVWFSQEFAGEKLPLLSEVLDLLGSDTYVDIEIKIDTLRCRAVAKKTAEVLADALKKNPANQNRFVVSSFNPLAIRQFSKFSTIPTALIYDSNPKSLWWIRGGRGKYFCSCDVFKQCHTDY